ncbi:MAG: response regulator transcription factor [Planctomycetes bacterium]|nr:response regulator transcription factor [Planctomycetota bacterium]
MTRKPATVFVIDDEEPSRDSVCALVQSMQYSTRAFDSGEAFLQQYDGSAGCVVTDYRMTGMNGLELQEKLTEQGHNIPVIIVTAYARTPVTVQAIQNGAVTLLDKPYSEDDLWNAIREGLALDEQRRNAKQERAEITTRIASLNEKERQVLDMIVAGQPNKVMANKLDVSLRTIENRRRTVFSKLGTQTVAELVALVLKQRAAIAN